MRRQSKQKWTEDARQALRMLVRARGDFQSIRKSMDNRMARKADGNAHKLKEGRTLSEEYQTVLSTISDDARKKEKEVEKEIKNILKKFPVWTEYLKNVKGVGHIAAAWIIGEFDIHKATTVSKLTQFCGLNPGMVRGKKRHDLGNGKFLIEVTDTMIRGDKLTPGYISPFNKRLRTALVGVMADGFIKSQNDYALNHYYRLHVPEKYRKDEDAMLSKPELAGKYGRLDCSDVMTTETKKGGKIISLRWKETTDSHRDRAAKREMVKKFLQDLYDAWRKIEGLPVRSPYAEEYLGKVHAQAE